ncbi:MAG: hypothetical protein PF495_18580 [Spirochaetales bacterium]|jgi:hypothetical protein|nr:hypothetical protein [Spirochaetales bacterium]
MKAVFSCLDTGLRAQEIDKLGEILLERNIPAIYCSEFDAPFFKKCHPSGYYGILIGHPFGGLSEQMIIRMISRTSELGCSAAVITLNTTALISGQIEEFKRTVFGFAQETSRLGLDLICDGHASLLTLGQLKILIQTVMEAGAAGISLSTESALDTPELEHFLFSDRIIQDWPEKDLRNSCHLHIPYSLLPSGVDSQADDFLGGLRSRIVLRFTDIELAAGFSPKMGRKGAENE